MSFHALKIAVIRNFTLTGFGKKATCRFFTFAFLCLFRVQQTVRQAPNASLPNEADHDEISDTSQDDDGSRSPVATSPTLKTTPE